MRRIGYILGLLAAFASFALAQVLPDSAQQGARQQPGQVGPYGAQVQQHGGEVRAAIAGQGRGKGAGEHKKGSPRYCRFFLKCCFFSFTLI